MYLLLKMVVFRCNDLWWFSPPPPPPNLLEKQLHLLDPNSQEKPTRGGNPKISYRRGTVLQQNELVSNMFFFFVFFEEIQLFVWDLFFHMDG